MPIATLLCPRGSRLREDACGDAAHALLRAAGAASGSWAAPRSEVSALPQLNHARELLALQRRFGSALTLRRRHLSPQGREEHVHDEAELRVVLGGTLRLRLRTDGAGGVLSVMLQPLDWVALPAGLPHAEGPSDAELLCLLHHRGRRDPAAAATPHRRAAPVAVAA